MVVRIEVSVRFRPIGSTAIIRPLSATRSVRDRVLRFNIKRPDGLTNGKAPGQPLRSKAEHQRGLLEGVEAGATPATHGVMRQRLIDLAHWICEMYQITITKHIHSRELARLAAAFAH